MLLFVQDASETQEETQRQATKVTCLLLETYTRADVTHGSPSQVQSPRHVRCGLSVQDGWIHLQVKDDDTVTLRGGREWQARHTAEGLQLTISHVASNGLQQVCGRKADTKNELDHRKQQVQALRAQRAELLAKMDQVIARTFLTHGAYLKFSMAMSGCACDVNAG